MPARDRDRELVKRALVNEGWTITHDPYRLGTGEEKLYVDLGAERAIAAERGDERIAVEIKGFLGPSEMRDFQQALGQYLLYHSLMREVDPDRKLFLAIPEDVYTGTFHSAIVRPVLEDYPVRLIVFRADEGKIVRWKP